MSGFNGVKGFALNVAGGVGLNGFGGLGVTGFGGLSFTPFNLLSGLTFDRPGTAGLEQKRGTEKGTLYLFMAK